MPTATDSARQALYALESRWISLLSWLAQRLEISEEELVSGWSPEAFYQANERLASESRELGQGATRWTVLHFLDFSRYSELAGRYNADLERRGNPPRNWRGIIGDQNNRGLIRYRNHLAHGNRFDLLLAEQQGQALELFQEQNACLTRWWPGCPVLPHRPAPVRPLRTAVKLLGSDPRSAGALVEELGMRSVPSPANLVPASVSTPLAALLAGSVEGFYRVGEATLGSTTAGMYVAYLSEWPERPSLRERYRRKVAKALVEHQTQDARWIAILLDHSGRSEEAEFILPRQRAGRGAATVRAVVDLREPNRYHIELLESLRVDGATSIAELSRKWNDAFSVEGVTKQFYDEFQRLRDRLVAALLEHNADNPVLRGRDPSRDRDFELQLNAFGTRQLGRLLFLWFLQQKRWLGGTPGRGDLSFLIDRFRERPDDSDTYFNDVLVPLFFDGLGLPLHDPRHRAVEERFGPVPFLGGGLFRPGADEFEAQLFDVSDEGERRRRVTLPDDLFDPAKDNPWVNGRRTGERTVLGLLRGYRFTTQESTPDDQSVDPDPELLGKVFETLYQADERHQTGAYYTPREIVHYMCRQALDGYLRDKAGVTQETIDRLRQEAEDWTVSDRRLETATASALVAALDEVKILDPAVGSGAFLVAATHEIVLLKRGIEQAERDQDIDPSSLDVADWKRRIITHCLYGVDINPMAVEICHLRLWLSMMVDLEVSNFRQIPPLPNLDFRVVAGDSLVDRMGEEPFIQSLPDPLQYGVQFDFETGERVRRLQEEVDRLQERFAGEGVRPHQLLTLRRQVREKQMEIARIQVDDAIERAQRQAERLARDPRATKRARSQAEGHLTHLGRLRDGLRPDAPSQKPFLWPVNFHEVFESGGFDVVVANPPYVRQEVLDPVDQEAYRHAFPEVYSGTADILVFFYARAVQVLRNGGQLAFITSNSFVKRAYGEGLQNFLGEELSISSVIDFGETHVFDATVEPYVLVGSKKAPSEGHELHAHYLFVEIARRAGTRSSVPAVREQIGDLPQLLEADHVAVPQRSFVENGWKIEPTAIVDLYRRLMSSGTPLGEFVQGRMYYGIKTGLNEAFVIDQAKRDELVAADPRSAELIKPWLRGQDIKRWKPEWAGLYLIAVQNSGDSDANNPWGQAVGEAEARRIFRETHPAVHDHLSKCEARLRARADQGRWWWELRACAYYQEFARPKFVWPDISRSLRFCWDESGALVDTTCFIAPSQPRWLLPVLNSEIGEFLLCMMTGSIRGGFMRLKMAYIEPFPVAQPRQNAAKDLERLATVMSSGKVGAAEEGGVDRLVAATYGLSEDESRLIGDWFRRRSISPDDEQTEGPRGDDEEVPS